MFLWLLGLGWYILLFCCVIGSFLLLYLCFALCLCLRKFSLVVCYVEQRRRESAEQRRLMLAELSDFSTPPQSPVPPLEIPDGSGGFRAVDRPMDTRPSEGVGRPSKRRRSERRRYGGY